MHVHCAYKIQSTLNKKHCSLAYHDCKQVVTSGTMRVRQIDTNGNLADPFTKQLTVQKRNYTFENWTN